MKNTYELYFNGYESTSCTSSSASVSSGSRKYHSWVRWFHLKESRWTPVCERSHGLEAMDQGNTIPWVGWLLSMVHSEIQQDHEANYWDSQA
jgi:hypothetical protein